MADIDDGYIPPEEIDEDEWDPGGQWDNSYRIDPETGEGFFASDPWDVYRMALLRVRTDEQKGIVRADREERLKRLEELRQRAFRGSRRADIESTKRKAKPMDVFHEDWRPEDDSDDV